MAIAGYRRRGPAHVAHGPRDGSAVALTFDDGPSAHTVEILDVLRTRSAAATFFVLGCELDGWDPVLADLLAAGCEIGNHSYGHPRLGCRPLATLREARRTTALVRRATGFAPAVFRAPYGSADRAVVRAARLAGMTTVRWDVDPRDWEATDPQAIERDVLSAVREGSIVLLHDGGGDRGATVSALPGILAGLAARGLECVTVSALLGYEPVRA